MYAAIGERNIAIFNKTIDEYTVMSGWENPIYSPDETAGIGKIVEHLNQMIDSFCFREPLLTDSVLKYGFNQLAGGVPFECFKQTGKFTGLFDDVEIESIPLLV